jgi:hypothetical protein
VGRAGAAGLWPQEQDAGSSLQDQQDAAGGWHQGQQGLLLCA